jgi:hypothetical protein
LEVEENEVGAGGVEIVVNRHDGFDEIVQDQHEGGCAQVSKMAAKCCFLRVLPHFARS